MSYTGTENDVEFFILSDGRFIKGWTTTHDTQSQDSILKHARSYDNQTSVSMMTSTKIDCPVQKDDVWDDFQDNLEKR